MLKRLGNSLLQSKWRGPFQLLLTTLTALKLGRVNLQTHYSRAKRAKFPQVIKKHKTLEPCFAIKVVECLRISRKFGNKFGFYNAELQTTPPGDVKKSGPNLLCGYLAGLG